MSLGKFRRSFGQPIDLPPRKNLALASPVLNSAFQPLILNYQQPKIFVPRFRFLTSTAILFVFVYAFINPQGSYYQQECNKRLECYNGCNKAYFPELACVEKPEFDFYYRYNHFDKLYLFKKPDDSKPAAKKAYRQCKSYILENEKFPIAENSRNRQIRVQSCFSYCRNGEELEFLGDDRPNCIDLKPQDRDQIICLYPDDECETTQVAGQVTFSTEGGSSFRIAPIQGILAIIVSNPLQIFHEVATVYLQQMHARNTGVSAKENCILLTFQCIMVCITTTLAGATAYFTTSVFASGDFNLVFCTFGLAWLADQAKSYISLSLIYIVVVRRFGFLKENEKEYIDPAIRADKRENALPELQQSCLKTLEHSTVEFISFFTISAYSVFILFDLGFTEIFPVKRSTMNLIDFMFLNVFALEIGLKTFASSGMFLIDAFNTFDAIIVFMSWVLMIFGITAKGLGVLRLIRVVVIIIRSITDKKSKLRHQSKNNNPLDSVIKILNQLQNLPEVSNSVRKEAKQALNIIESNKLYDLNIDMGSEEKTQELEAKAWISMTTEAYNDTTSWFERDLDDFLKELHRENEELDQNQIEEDEERLKQIIKANGRHWTNILKLMDDFEKWDFDVFQYCETLQEQSLIHFCFKLFQQYGLLEKFSIADQNFLNLLNNIRSQTYEQNSYHNVTKVIELTRNFHYFTKQGELMQYYTDLNIMAGFLACMMADISHPGVNNAFLIAMRHTKALRYNDKSVLENHHCAIAFKLLLDPQNDIFELLSEAQYWGVRQVIIKMILSSDLSNHFDLINAFKSRATTKNFPEDTMEDKQLILNITMYAADHAAPCKPSLLYFKWMAAEMEEYYQQGDLERKLDYTPTPFFDRTQSNPFKFQLGYLDVVVIPLFQVMTEFKEVFREDCVTKGVEENRKMLEQKIDETKHVGGPTNSQSQATPGERPPGQQTVKSEETPKAKSKASE